jgi:hypothetical protein
MSGVNDNDGESRLLSRVQDSRFTLLETAPIEQIQQPTEQQGSAPSNERLLKLEPVDHVWVIGDLYTSFKENSKVTRKPTPEANSSLLTLCSFRSLNSGVGSRASGARR